jgi:alpha-ketoglutarate-dependent taurine dioxygenase
MSAPPHQNQPLFGLEPSEFLALQVTVLSFAFRALLTNHADPAKVRSTFDQLLGQLQASPAIAGQGQQHADAIRSFAANLFQPPVLL